MPEINLHSAGARAGRASGPGAVGGPAGAGGDFQRISFSAMESARMEMRLRKALNEYERREQKRLFDEKLRQERIDGREQRRLEQDRRREQARIERADRQEARRVERAEESQRARRRAAWRRAGEGALIGGVIGSAGRGDLSGTVGALGGAAGGLIGELAFGPVGAIIGAAIGELAAHALNPAGPIAKAATRAAELQIGSYALARAGGFGGNATYQGFSPGNAAGHVPLWASRLGLSASDALQLASSLGVVPRSQGDVLGLATAVRGYGLSPAYSALPAGMVGGVLSQGLGYGMASPTATGSAGYLNQFSDLLEEASARGFDRSKLLGSIQEGIETLAKSGALGISPGGISDLVWRLAATGTPGGRTGALAAQTIAGVSSTLENVVQNPLTSTLLMSQLGRFGNLRTPADVQRFVGPQAWTALNSGGQGAQTGRIVAMINQAASEGNFPMALTYASQLMRADPGRLQEVLSPTLGMATGGRGYLTAPLLSNAMGVPLSTATALATAPSTRPPAGHTAGWINSLSNFISGNVAPGFDSKVGEAGYVKMLTSAGVPADVARMLAAEGANSGTNPMLLASLAAQGSGGDVRKLSRTDALAVNGRGDARFRSLLGQSGGNVSKALQAYGGGGRGGLDFSKSVADVYAKLSGKALNLPTEAFAVNASAAQGELFVSNTALLKLAPAAVSAATALSNLASTLQDSLSDPRLAKALAGYAGGGHAGGPP